MVVRLLHEGEVLTVGRQIEPLVLARRPSADLPRAALVGMRVLSPESHQRSHGIGDVREVELAVSLGHQQAPPIG